MVVNINWVISKLNLIIINKRVLLFPKDLLIELEYWAQTGEYDMEELEEVSVNLATKKEFNLNIFF